MLITELETALTSFRALLGESWTRYAIRMLTLDPTTSTNNHHSLSSYQSSWASQNLSYHNTFLDELNGLVRRYNGVAPAAVRRPFLVREVELSRVYEGCKEDIQKGVEERRLRPNNGLEIGGASWEDEGNTIGGEGVGLGENIRPGGKLGIWEAVKSWFRRA